jgi:exopolysaccharide biosynthesis polyprenyl glycosylphosphotransferase
LGNSATTSERSTARQRAAAPWLFRRWGAPDAAAASDWEGFDSDISPVWEDATPIPGIPETARRSALSSRDSFLKYLLAIADIAGAFAALLVTVLVGQGAHGLRPEAILVAPFILFASKAVGLYDRDQHTLRKTTLDEIPAIFYLGILFGFAVLLTEGLLLNGWMARPQLFGLVAFSFLFTTAGRCAARLIARRGLAPERCLFLGNGADATRTANKLEGSPGVNAFVIGRVALRSDRERSGGERPRLGMPTLGYVDSLPRVVGEHSIERVIIAPDSDEPDEILHAIRLLKALGVKVSVLPRLLEVVGSSSTFDEIDGITLLGVRQYGLPRSSGWLKRVMDVVGAGAGLLLLSPTLIILALAVKLDSRGPVFFKQPRIGRKGKRFHMVKFRSMVHDADQIKDELRTLNEAEGGLFKITADPRVTRVGRLLRQTSLDELPQLINVVRGDMSLVGPRPLVPDEDALIEGWERRRLAVRPGMTGLWQIYGSSRIPMPEMVKIDYLYGANWSIWLDLKILLRTFPYVLSRRGV